MISLLEILGFERIREIKEDMIPERISYIYEADPKDVIDFFC